MLQLIWAVQELLLWCFVCTHAQIKAIAPLIKQKACGKINNLIHRQKMDVGVQRKPTTFLECSLWSRWYPRPVLSPDSCFSGNIKASASHCLRPTVLGKVVKSQCSTQGGAGHMAGKDHATPWVTLESPLFWRLWQDSRKRAAFWIAPEEDTRCALLAH